MTRSIKDLCYFGHDIELVTPEEEAQMPDFHRRHTISYIQSCLGAAQEFAINGRVLDAEDELGAVIVRTIATVDNPDFIFDRQRFFNTVFAEVEKGHALILESSPHFRDKKLVRLINQLAAKGETLSNPAPAHEQPALTI